MNYETIKLHKDMYKAPGGFKASLEALDPTHAYKGTELGALDAFQRQLKRFDIKVGGASSDIIAKFFQTPDSSALFPEYVSRAVEQARRIPVSCPKLSRLKPRSTPRITVPSPQILTARTTQPPSPRERRYLRRTSR